MLEPNGIEHDDMTVVRYLLADISPPQPTLNPECWGHRRHACPCWSCLRDTLGFGAWVHSDAVERGSPVGLSVHALSIHAFSGPLDEGRLSRCPLQLGKLRSDGSSKAACGELRPLELHFYGTR